jgi:hypothetical protein
VICHKSFISTTLGSVRVGCDDGWWSEWSDVSTALATASAVFPSAPIPPLLLRAGSSTVLLRLFAPDNNGGSPVTELVLRVFSSPKRCVGNSSSCGHAFTRHVPVPGSFVAPPSSLAVSYVPATKTSRAYTYRSSGDSSVPWVNISKADGPSEAIWFDYNVSGLESLTGYSFQVML